MKEGKCQLQNQDSRNSRISVLVRIKLRKDFYGPKPETQHHEGRNDGNLRNWAFLNAH